MAFLVQLVAVMVQYKVVFLVQSAMSQQLDAAYATNKKALISLECIKIATPVFIEDGRVKVPMALVNNVFWFLAVDSSYNFYLLFI